MAFSDYKVFRVAFQSRINKPNTQPRYVTNKRRERLQKRWKPFMQEINLFLQISTKIPPAEEN